MRRFSIFLAVAILLAPRALRAADGPNFDEFRIPDHHGHGYNASGAFTYSRASDGPTDSWGASRMASNTFRTEARWFCDTDARQWNAGVRGELNGTRQSNESRQAIPGSSTQSEDRFANLDERLEVLAGARIYGPGAPLALELQFSASLDDGQLWDRMDNRTAYDRLPAAPDRTTSLNSSQSWQYRRFVLGSAGVGWGRVRDASTVYLAWTIEQRWLRSGALSRPLSAEARAKLAQLLSIQGVYGLVHDLPDKAFWRDAEAILRADGALTGDHLDAYSSGLARDLLEPFSLAGDARLVGARVGPFLQIQHVHAFTRGDYAQTSAYSYGDTLFNSSEFRSSSRFRDYVDRAVVGLVAEMHRACGVRTQLDANANATADARGLRRFTHVQASLQARRWVAERWMWSARLDQIRDVGRMPVATDYWDSRAGLGAAYFLEDHWSLGLEARMSRSMRDVPSGTTRRETNVFLSFGYNRGILEAPELITPVRPLN